MATWKNNISALKRTLSKAKRVLVVSHTNPDGDAVGSALGWQHYMRAAYPETEVRVAFPNNFPKFLKWIDGARNVMIYADMKDVVQRYLNRCDLVICLDFNALSRLDDFGKDILNSTPPRVLIDHHLQPTDGEYTLVFSDISMSSTSEFAYRVIVELGGKAMLTKAAAEAFYTGLITDTGSFTFGIHTPEVFRMAADMMELGVDKDQVAANVYDSYSENRMRLMGYCLYEKMRVLPQHKAAYIALSQDELRKYDFKPGDTEGFSNLPLSIKGIELAGFFTEAPDKTHIRVSLRSKGKGISVNDLAREEFKGGGHFNAAGGKFFKSLEECEKRFEEILKERF